METESPIIWELNDGLTQTTHGANRAVHTAQQNTQFFNDCGEVLMYMGIYIDPFIFRNETAKR